MEDVRKRRSIRITKSWDGHVSGTKFLIAQPNFRNLDVWNDDVCVVEMDKTCVLLNKPIYCGVAILDISKTYMYSYHYEYFKDRYGEKATLMYTDTDSLLYSIETEDVYADM